MDFTLQELHGFCPNRSLPKNAVAISRIYAPYQEKICLEFLPLYPKTANPKWEDWHCYRSVLRIYLEDYERLLMPYFNRIFPTTDPIGGETQDFLDVCFDNWIGKEAWDKWLILIKKDLPSKPAAEQVFYKEVLGWIETVLTNTDVIVVEGNL